MPTCNRVLFCNLPHPAPPLGSPANTPHTHRGLIQRFVSAAPARVCCDQRPRAGGRRTVHEPGPKRPSLWFHSFRPTTHTLNTTEATRRRPRTLPSRPVFPMVLQATTHRKLPLEFSALSPTILRSDSCWIYQPTDQLIQRLAGSPHLGICPAAPVPAGTCPEKGAHLLDVLPNGHRVSCQLGRHSGICRAPS